MSDIDARIEKIKKKERSADNLNLLGDLYLKKGDALTAIRYFHAAAGVARKDKAIALYKKVLRLSPSDIAAIEALINIFAKTGLITEEIKYLLLLAHHYHEKGKGQEEIRVYRRILLLDPVNESALHYFGKGKPPARASTDEEEVDIYRMHPPQEEPEPALQGVPEETTPPESEPVGPPPVPPLVTEEPASELPTDAPFESGVPEVAAMESGLPETSPEEGRSVFEEAPQSELPEGETIESVRAEPKDARIDQMPDEWREAPPPRRTPSFWAVAGVVLLILVAGLVSYLSREAGKKRARIQRPVSVEELRIANTRSVEGITFEVEVTRLVGDLLKETPILTKLTPTELKENGFFSVTLKAAGGCIPEELVTAHKNISVIGRDGVPVAPVEMSGLVAITKAFYKEGVCGSGPGIVYARLYIAYPQAVKPRGLLINGVKIVFEKSATDGYTQ